MPRTQPASQTRGAHGRCRSPGPGHADRPAIPSGRRPPPREEGAGRRLLGTLRDEGGEALEHTAAVTGQYGEFGGRGLDGSGSGGRSLRAHVGEGPDRHLVHLQVELHAPPRRAAHAERLHQVLVAGGSSVAVPVQDPQPLGNGDEQGVGARRLRHPYVGPADLRAETHAQHGDLCLQHGAEQSQFGATAGEVRVGGHRPAHHHQVRQTRVGSPGWRRGLPAVRAPGSGSRATTSRSTVPGRRPDRNVITRAQVQVTSYLPADFPHTLGMRACRRQNSRTLIAAVTVRGFLGFARTKQTRRWRMRQGL